MLIDNLGTLMAIKPTGQIGFKMHRALNSQGARS